MLAKLELQLHSKLTQVINELLMPIILKLFKSLENKKNKNWENVTHLGTT